MSIVHQAPWAGVIPINPLDEECPVDRCENLVEKVCPTPSLTDRLGVRATSGIWLCDFHADVLARIVATGRGGFTVARRKRADLQSGIFTVRLAPPPPVTRGEWKRALTDLVAILHDLHQPAATTKGH